MNENFPCKKGEAYLFTDRRTRKYVAKKDVAEGYLIVDGDNTVYFTDARYFSAAKAALDPFGVISEMFADYSSIGKYLENHGIKSLKIDYDKTTLTEYGEYKKLCGDISDCSATVKAARAVKRADEAGYISRACEIAQKAYHDALSSVGEGMTEIQLKEVIEKNMFDMGAEETSFDTIVAFGANGAVPHHVTGETKLKKDMPILVDMGCRVEGYCSDLTRMAYYGTPDEKFLRCYDAVKRAGEEAEKKIRSSMMTDAADAIARDLLKEEGLDKYFTHSLGHGVGLDIHEFPVLSPKRRDELKDGMVFSIEPGVYFDGEFGIRIEDTVILSGGKVKRLFTDSKELNIIKK